MSRRKTTAPKEQTSRRTGFLHLSAELRNEIYELALEDTTIVFPGQSASNPTGRAKCPGILMASKQIYQDALVMFYSKATFHFEVQDRQDRLLSWLRKLGTQKRRLLQHVIVDEIIGKANLYFFAAPMEDNAKWRVTERLRALERRLQDSGLALKYGSLTMNAKCWHDYDTTTIYAFACRQGRENDERYRVRVLQNPMLALGR